MSVAALIQFTQGATITPAGEAMVGQAAVQVVCANDNDAGVASHAWSLTSVPIGSALSAGPLGTTPTVGFTPDIPGSYLVSCVVTGANATDTATDRRVFSIVNSMGWIIPAFRGNADAHNFGGQARGWAGTATYEMLDSLFGYITTMLSGADPSDVLTWDGSVWGPKPGGGGGTFVGNIRTVTGPDPAATVGPTDGIIECDTTLGDITFTLSTALPDGQIFIIKDVAGAANTHPIYIASDFPDYIDDGTQVTINQNFGSMVIQRQVAPPASNAVWGVIAEYKQGLSFENKGVFVSTGDTTLNFAGTSITDVTTLNGTTTVTIDGGAGSGSIIEIDKGGTLVSKGDSALNFAGTAVTSATSSKGVTTVTIDQSAASLSKTQWAGNPVSSSDTTINLAGTAVTKAASAGGVSTYTIDASAGSSIITEKDAANPATCSTLNLTGTAVTSMTSDGKGLTTYTLNQGVGGGSLLVIDKGGKQVSSGDTTLDFEGTAITSATSSKGTTTVTIDKSAAGLSITQWAGNPLSSSDTTINLAGTAVTKAASAGSVSTFTIDKGLTATQWAGTAVSSTDTTINLAGTAVTNAATAGGVTTYTIDSGAGATITTEKDAANPGSCGTLNLTGTAVTSMTNDGKGLTTYTLTAGAGTALITEKDAANPASCTTLNLTGSGVTGMSSDGKGTTTYTIGTPGTPPNYTAANDYGFRTFPDWYPDSPTPPAVRWEFHVGGELFRTVAPYFTGLGFTFSIQIHGFWGQPFVPHGLTIWVYAFMNHTGPGVGTVLYQKQLRDKAIWQPTVDSEVNWTGYVAAPVGATTISILSWTETDQVFLAADDMRAYALITTTFVT